MRSPADPFRGEPPALAPSYTPRTSIFDLGLILAQTRAVLRRIDEDATKRQQTVDGDTIHELMSDREDALNRLIPTLPAVTLADAAVQIEVASSLASDLVGIDWTKPDLNRLHLNLYRLILSAHPVIAAAAGLDVDAMRWGDTVLLKRQHFEVEECVA